VLFVDIHQDNLFPPHSGGVCETGSGFTVNIPLSPGSGGERYLDVMDTAVYSALAAYKPELICVSAGFDAASGDLEANMELSPRDFGAMTERICAWADAFCGGRVFMTLEGGYRIESLSEAVGECVEVLRSWKQR
jgi:acetoin utilization deacetylase AcuC-like enzyme